MENPAFLAVKRFRRGIVVQIDKSFDLWRIITMRLASVWQVNRPLRSSQDRKSNDIPG